MSNYLGSLKSFEVEYAAADEIVTPEGQKLQFLHSGEVTLKRPDKLHVIRRGAAGIGEIFLDGKKLSFFGKALDVYVQLDASSIDVAVEAMRKMGFDASGADFLAAKPLNPATTDIISGTHVGMTYIDGVQVHQLAFRGKEGIGSCGFQRTAAFAGEIRGHNEMVRWFAAVYAGHEEMEHGAAG